jgi:hypothetical protein
MTARRQAEITRADNHSIDTRVGGLFGRGVAG